MKYYSTLRPVSIGTFPKPVDNTVKDIVNFDRRTYIDSIKHEAWGYIEYEHELDSDTAKQYDLTKEESMKIEEYTTDFAVWFNTTGFKMKEFSEVWGIPYRTVQDWRSGKGKCPDYVLKMLKTIYKTEE